MRFWIPSKVALLVLPWLGAQPPRGTGRVRHGEFPSSPSDHSTLAGFCYIGAPPHPSLLRFVTNELESHGAPWSPEEFESTRDSVACVAESRRTPCYTGKFRVQGCRAVSCNDHVHQPACLIPACRESQRGPHGRRPAVLQGVTGWREHASLRPIRPCTSHHADTQPAPSTMEVPRRRRAPTDRRARCSTVGAALATPSTA